MITIDNKKYYTTGELFVIVNRDRQTINKWNRINRKLVEMGEKNILPLGKRHGYYVLYTKEDVEEFIRFRDSIKYKTISKLMDKTGVY